MTPADDWCRSSRDSTSKPFTNPGAPPHPALPLLLLERIRRLQPLPSFSAVHINNARLNLAFNPRPDRFSTFLDHGCQWRLSRHIRPRMQIFYRRSAKSIPLAAPAILLNSTSPYSQFR